MRRNRFGSSNISGILWFALGVLVLCVSATFFHVFDIERLFKNQTEDAFEGHVDTATAEIESEIDYIRGVMDNYFDNVTSIHDAELISEIILSQEKYSTGYEFYYLTKEAEGTAFFLSPPGGFCRAKTKKLSKIALFSVFCPALLLFDASYGII